MTYLPRIKRKFSLIIHNENHVEFRTGVWHSQVINITDEENAGYLSTIISKFNGKNSPQEIAALTGVLVEDVKSVIDHLQDNNLLQDKPESALDLYLDMADPEFASLAQEKSTHNDRDIIIIGDTTLIESTKKLLKEYTQSDKITTIHSTDPLYSALENSDQSWLKDPLLAEQFIEPFSSWKGSLIVMLSQYINPTLTLALNKVTYLLNIPWLHAAFDGPFAIIGPTFLNGNSPCYECFENRVYMNMREKNHYQHYKNALSRAKTIMPKNYLDSAIRSLLTSHVVMEINNILSTDYSFTTNQALMLYLPTMDFSFQEFLKVPHCTTCGSNQSRQDCEPYFDMHALLNE